MRRIEPMTVGTGEPELGFSFGSLFGIAGLGTTAGRGDTGVASVSTAARGVVGAAPGFATSARISGDVTLTFRGWGEGGLFLKGAIVAPRARSWLRRRS